MGVQFLCLLLVFTAQTLAFIPNDIFATKDERLFELFCVDTVEELEAVGKSTKTHDDITGLGLKRALIKFFTDQRPELDLDASSSLTLSAIYQLVYGKCASPLNFLESVKDISDANVFMDGPATALDPTFHFDSEKIAESQDLLISRYPSSKITSLQGSSWGDLCMRFRSFTATPIGSRWDRTGQTKPWGFLAPVLVRLLGSQRLRAMGQK